MSRAIVLAVPLVVTLVAACGGSSSKPSAGEVRLAGKIVTAEAAQDGVRITSAFAEITYDVPPDSNTGHPCVSKRLVRVTMLGQFDNIAVSPPPGTVATNAKAVIDVADPASGQVCLSGVATSAPHLGGSATDVLTDG